jgi:hypothetical protein
MNISGVIAMFIAILVASGVLLYIGTIGLKGDKKDEQIKEEEDQK